MTHDQAEALLGFAVPAGWQFQEVRRAGELAGFIMSRGAEVHAWRLERYAGRWLTTQDLQRALRPILEQFGYVSTMVRLDNTAGHQFVTRLGFYKTGEAAGNALYRATRFPHARL